METGLGTQNRPSEVMEVVGKDVERVSKSAVESSYLAFATLGGRSLCRKAVEAARSAD